MAGGERDDPHPLVALLADRPSRARCVCRLRRRRGRRPGTVQDEAMRAGLTAEHFVRKTDDYFRDMDDNLVDGKRPVFTQPEIEGRNMWMVWTGGNDRLWDRLTIDSIGSFDLLKTISSHPQHRLRPAQPVALSRARERAVLHRSDRSRSESLRAVARRARSEVPARSVCRSAALSRRARSARAGPSCRSAPTTASRPAWSACGCSPIRISTRRRAAALELRTVLQRSGVLLRPRSRPAVPRRHVVRVLPRRPESDPAARRSGEPGMGASELERRRAVFLVGPRLQLAGRQNAASIFYQALHVSRPGTLDTSLVSTDNINNPRTMNAVYYLGPRMGLAKKWGKETMAGGGLRNKQFNEFVPPDDPLAQFFAPPSTTWTPRVLKDGSDSVGALGALNRVYINIGAVQRGVAAALPRAARRRADLADSARDHPEELGLLARDREADAVHGALLPRQHRSALSEGCAGRREVPDRTAARRSIAARSCSPSAARAATRASCRRCPPVSISRTPTAPTI